MVTALYDMFMQPAGQGIASHVDTHSPFGDFIFSLSLAAGTSSLSLGGRDPVGTSLCARVCVCVCVCVVVVCVSGGRCGY